MGMNPNGSNPGSSSNGGGGAGAPRHSNVMDGKRLCITVSEAASMLGVSRNFAYELVKTKQLPVIRFGKRLLIPKLALEKTLEGVVPG
jgi:excisionase family DNA binding protein